MVAQKNMYLNSININLFFYSTFVYVYILSGVSSNIIKEKNVSSHSLIVFIHMKKSFHLYFTIFKGQKKILVKKYIKNKKIIMYDNLLINNIANM